MATLRGSLDSSDSPFVTIAVSAPSEPSQFVDALIDTGFTGFVQLPERRARELGLPLRAVSKAQYADGRIGTIPLAWAKVTLGSDAQEGFVHIQSGSDEVIIGVEPLRTPLLTYRHGSYRTEADWSSAISANRHSALISRICSTVRACDSGRRGLATMKARHIARETATLRRLREKRKSRVRGTSLTSRLPHLRIPAQGRTRANEVKVAARARAPTRSTPLTNQSWSRDHDVW